MLRIPQDRIQQPAPLRPPVGPRQTNHPALEPNTDMLTIRTDIQELREGLEETRMGIDRLHDMVSETDMLQLTHQ